MKANNALNVRTFTGISSGITSFDRKFSQIRVQTPPHIWYNEWLGDDKITPLARPIREQVGLWLFLKGMREAGHV